MWLSNRCILTHDVKIIELESNVDVPSYTNFYILDIHV